MKTEILTILHEQTGFVSGQDLCEQLGVSRTAIWKVMKQLKKEGYEIESVQNKGYRLIQIPDIISPSEIKSRLQCYFVGQEIKYQKETGSTNTDAKQLAEEGYPNGTLVLADRQRMGRGRRGRVWESVEGRNLYFSLLLRPEIQPEHASMLTLVMGLSVAQAIQACTGIKCQIKWPNDLVIHGKKVCGILTEMSTEPDYIHHVVIGVGVNVNQESFGEGLEHASSLRLEKGMEINRIRLLLGILERFEENYAVFLKKQTLHDLAHAYNSILVNRYATVKVLEEQGAYEGIAKGINDKGELLVQKEDGSIVQIFGGEVSVRGIYGYV